MKKVKIFLHIYVYVIHIMQYACIGRKKLTLILWWKLFPPFCAFSNWIFWHTLHPYPVLGKPSLKKSHKTANFFRSSLPPPPLPSPPLPASTDTYGGLFSKSAYCRIATFGEKARMFNITIIGGTHHFHWKFINLSVK